MTSSGLVDMLCEFKKLFNLEQLKIAILFDVTTYCDSKKRIRNILKNARFLAYSFVEDFLKENEKVKNHTLKYQNLILMTIRYTSDTTGNQKGVMLSQRKKSYISLRNSY